MSLSAQMQNKFNQRYTEAGLIVGALNYSGDLAERHIQISETRLGYGAFIRRFISPKISMRANLYRGSITGDDAHSNDPIVNQRSFRFRTNMLELAAAAEWHIWGKSRYAENGIHRSFISPYLNLGVGGLFSNVKVDYYGTSEDRSTFIKAPLPEKKTRQQFLIVPVGIGVRADISERLVIGTEFGFRPLFSDYLDGVSINGNPHRNDWYYFGGVSLSYILTRPPKVL